jgi:hypothetical protein
VKFSGKFKLGEQSLVKSIDTGLPMYQEEGTHGCDKSTKGRSCVKKTADRLLIEKLKA